jgi:hypothetical protein
LSQEKSGSLSEKHRLLTLENISAENDKKKKKY